MEMSDIINYRDNTHVITDYRYDSFGRRIHTAERTKSGMRTIYDGLSFEVVKEAETFLGTRGITSSATGEANLNNYTPQVPQNGWHNNTAPSYGSDHTKGTRYYYIPNNAQGSQTRNNGETTQSAPSYGSDHTKGTRYYYIPNNAQGTQTAQDERNTQSSPSYGSEHTRGTRYYHIPDNPQSSQAQHSAIPVDRTKGVRTYLYLNGERVAINNLYNTNHGQYYYGSDILGSVKFITGQGGQELKRIEYDVFGGIYKGASPYGLETGYTGKPYDAVTGLSDYGFRDYSPKYARFITEDPIRDGENWFAYVGNNPVNFIDPWGLSASDGRGNNGNANLLLSGLTKTLSGSVKTVTGLAGAAAGMLASAVLVADNGTVVLTVDDAALLVTVPFTAASGKYALNGAKEAVDGLTDLTAGVVGTTKTLGTWIGGTAKSAWDNISLTKKGHEDRTYGKVKNQIESKLGRKLTKQEQELWHDAMGEYKQKHTSKEEHNPSLTEDELRQAAEDALEIQLDN